MDNITPLRQVQSATSVHDVVLFKPQKAMRIRWNMNTDTPLPPEEPAGQNPPDGAAIDIAFKSDITTPVVLEIFDPQNKLIRKISSTDTAYAIPPLNIPLYWIRPQQLLSSKAGGQRFLWDMRYEPLNEPVSYPMTAVKNNTARNHTAPWVMPGLYKVKLTANGQTIEQPLEIVMDPRVKTTMKDLKRQHDLSMICYEGKKKTRNTNPSLYRKYFFPFLYPL